jgi:hypothetical protein
MENPPAGDPPKISPMPAARRNPKASIRIVEKWILTYPMLLCF